MDWLVTLLALLLFGGLRRADAAPESSMISTKTTTMAATELEDPETSTIPITSLRMYHFDPPAKRRSFKVASTPKPREEPPQPQNTTTKTPPNKEVTVGGLEQFNRTFEVVQPRSGKVLLPQPPSHCYLNETKANDEEIIGWLRDLPADRKLRLLKGLGYDPANCTRPRRRCSKKTPPEMRKSLTPPPALTKLPTTTPKTEEPLATTTTTTTTPEPSTTTTTETPETTTLTPESEELITTTTTEGVPRRRMLPLTTTTTTTTPDPTFTDESVTPSSSASSTTTSTTVAPPPKKEKSKCRKKKKAAAAVKRMME